MTYPIKIRVKRDILEELAACEHGSYEDGEREEDESRPLRFHVYDVARRHASTLEIRCAEEAEDAYYAVCSGTFQLWHFKTACRIADTLRPHVKESTVKRWPAPYDDGR